MLKNRKETEQETIKRISKLAKDGEFFPFAPPMNAQVALNELCKHFLGDDWYTINPINQEQINTEIVYEIERKYPRKVNRRGKHAK